MKMRRLGRKGPLVSELGLGCMGMSEFYGARNDEESTRVVHRAFELGVTFFDTADIYGIGHNEELVGKAIKGFRDRIVLATKFGNQRGPKGEWLGVNGRPEYVGTACEASLRRLDVTVIDLYYLHRVDTEVPIEETVGAMGRLVEQGKVRYLGLSEAAAATLRRAHKVHPISALQTEYSLWSREPEEEILPTVRELGIGFVAYSPLGRGFLSGTLRNVGDVQAEGDNRRNFPRFEPDNLRRNVEWLGGVEKIAAAKKCTLSQLVLAWVMAQGEDVVPIPGTKRIKYLEENLAAANVHLTGSELRRLDELAPVGVAAGDRYYSAGMRTVSR